MFWAEELQIKERRCILRTFFSENHLNFLFHKNYTDRTLYNLWIFVCSVGPHPLVMFWKPCGSTFDRISSLYQTLFSITKQRESCRSLTHVTKRYEGVKKRIAAVFSPDLEFLPSEFDETHFPKVLSVLPCSTCHTPHPGWHIGRKAQ